MKKATLALIIGTVVCVSLSNSAIAGLRHVMYVPDYSNGVTPSNADLAQDAILGDMYQDLDTTYGMARDAQRTAGTNQGNIVDLYSQLHSLTATSTATAADQGQKIANNTATVAEQGQKIASNTATVAEQGQKIASNTANINANQSAVVALAQNVQSAQNTGAYAESRAEAAMANTEANKSALAKTNQSIAANSSELANHESRIDALEANTGAGNSFARLKNQVDDNRQRASAGIAGVAAMANIPQVTQGATFSVGAGAGTTDGESALAVGFSARATENTVIKASVSNDSQQNFVVGAGAAYQW